MNRERKTIENTLRAMREGASEAMVAEIDRALRLLLHGSASSGLDVERLIADVEAHRARCSGVIQGPGESLSCRGGPSRVTCPICVSPGRWVALRPPGILSSEPVARQEPIAEITSPRDPSDKPGLLRHQCEGGPGLAVELSTDHHARMLKLMDEARETWPPGILSAEPARAGMSVSGDPTDAELAELAVDIKSGEFPRDTTELLVRLIAEIRRRRDLDADIVRLLERFADGGVAYDDGGATATVIARVLQALRPEGPNRICRQCGNDEAWHAANRPRHTFKR